MPPLGTGTGGRGPATGSYLVVANWREHLHYSDRRAKWIKAYVAGDDRGRRGLDDDVLTGLPVTTRLAFELFLKLAARFDNFVPYDHRRIGGWLSMRPDDVAKAVKRLVEEGYLEVVNDVRISGNGDLQLPLGNAGEPPAKPKRHPDPIASDTPTDTPTDTPSEHQAIPPADPDVMAQLSGLDEHLASGTVRLTRAGARAAEQEQELERSTSNATVLRDAPPAMPSNEKTEEITRRIIGLVCRGDARSAASIRAAAAGMPESVLGRALESYLGRRPRPSNPGGYVVNAIRSIADEQGLTVNRARIEREPEL